MPRLTLLPAFLAVAACSGGADSAACPEIEGETHLDTQSSSPDGVSLMLHLVGLSCPVVGQDTLHVYESGSGEDSGMEMGGDAVTVTAVEAVMPDMGHGSTQDPEVHTDDPSEFDVWFQMAGTWRLSLTATVGEMDTAQTVSYDLDVVEP